MKKEYKFNTCFLIIILNTVSVITNEHQLQCPEMCICDFTRGRGSKSLTENTKLKCGGSDYSRFLLQDLNLTSLEPYITQLELSSNGITHLENSFLNLHNVQKLDLSRNEIEKIDLKAFKNLWNLRRLDLSYNRITEIQSEIFEPLQWLERLKLSHNLLVHIYEGGFDSLKALKQLDISDNPLMCDCDLMWLVDWSKNSSVKLVQPLKCESPPLLKGQLIKKIKLHCNDHTSIYTSENGLELKPMHDQIVFEGDSLCLRCRSLTAGALGGESRDVRVTWTWQNKDPASYFDKIKIENRLFADHGFVESQLRIDEIQRGHSGDWYCHLLSEQGNHSTAITVIVLSEDSKYCSESVTRNNKGVYFWPKTVVGFTVDLPCEGEQSTTILNTVEPRASYSCNESGFWENLNTTQCPYISETTKILEQFSRLNLSIPKNSVLESAKKLKNFTSDGKVITDVMDVVFISRTIENYLSFVKGDKELGYILIDIIASVMQSPKSLLTAAQKENLACSSMVKSVEKISRDTPTIQSHKNVLAVEEFGVTGAFSGIRCIWYSNPRSDKNPGRIFHCSTSNKTTLLGTSDKVIEASIQIPSSLFYQLDMQGKSAASIRQLIVSMYENNHFFPAVKNGDEDVTSCVVGSSLVGVEVTNLTDPVYIMLRVPTISYAASPKPVWWDQSLDDGNGWWNQDGCQLAHFMQGLVVFHCDRLGYFGLLQDTRYINEYSGRYIGAKSRLCHPAVYTGSFILIVCLIVSIVTYLISYSFIQMSRRAKHSVVNTWISISLLCFMFSCGIYQTEDMKICQGVGLILHYLSLSTLLWMSVTANNMYKRLSKSDHLDNAPEDDLPPGVPIQKPILGLYLVGWGIGLIVCGISGAVNLREYAGQHFCFLGSGPALSAIFVPAGILLAVLSLFYFLTLCAIRNNDMNGQLSEGTQGTENVDLELLEVPVANGCVDRRSIQSMVTTDSDDVEDPEHSPIIQLKAHVIVLVLYCFLWITASLSVLDAFRDYFSYQEDIFSILYCLFAFCLGAFILYFYCVARSDVRSQWTVLRKLIQGNGFQCCRSRSVSDSHGNVQIPTSAVVVSNGTGTRHTVSALSSSSINSSGLTNKSNSHNSNRVKAVKKLNNCDARGEDSVVIHSKTTNNVNLVAMHRQMYRSNNSMPTYHEISGPDCLDAFYNPRQSIVARKFFKKQRRNKRNDLGLRRRGDGGGTSDGEVSQARRTWRPSAESAVFLSSDMENTSDKIGPTFFGYGSKVNNTNIHVGQSSSGKHKKSISPKNPNILSDSDEESRSKLPIDRLVIGAEEEAGTSNSKNNNYDCGLSRVDEISVSEEVNSTAVNLSENSAKEVSQELLPKENDTDDDYSNEVCNDVTPTGPDYRTVELQCSLGENSCSDLNSEMNYCDSTNNDDCSSPTNCCNDACPPDCCSKNKSTCDSFNEKIDSLHLNNESVEEKAEKSCVKKSTPQYVTVVDPQYGLVKVSVNEYKEFCSNSPLDYDDEEDDETLVEHSPDSEKTKKETSV